MSPGSFVAGDWVVYRKPKCTTHPGPRARDVHAAANGDSYFYSVEKFWIVVGVERSGQLVLQTRRGKRHLVAADDPLLRRATWWDRIRFRAQFKSLSLSECRAAVRTL